jgi:hypothetical protein
MPRPALDTQLRAETFLRWYWLKEELTAFCQLQGLSTSGSKQAITERIARYLASGEKSAPVSAKPAAKGRILVTFTRETVIGHGWACSQPLRAFFEREIGPSFHFDAVMRDFIHHRHGQTLGAAIQAWQAAQANPTEKEIAPQFEYNRHIRAYLKANPGAGLKEAIAAWNERKQRPTDAP